MKKKLVILVLAGTLMMSAAACGKKDSQSAAEATQTETEAQAEGAADEKAEVSGTDREDYVPVSELDMEDYVTLNDYKNMVVEVEKTEVTDDTIKKYINQNVLDKIPVTDRAAQNGDTVTIDFEGKKDGVAFDGGTATGYTLVLGSNSFIPGFEEGLVGVEPGKTVDLDLTFPEDYHVADLAGQPVVFTVTVQNILVNGDYDTITDEQIAELGTDAKTKEDIWTNAKKVVEDDAQVNYESAISNAIIEQLMQNCVVDTIPDYLVEEEVNAYQSYVEQICASYYGCDLETFLQYQDLTMDEFKDQVTTMANDTVKQYLIMEAISRKEGFQVTDDEIMEKASEEAAQYGYESAQEAIDAIGKTMYRLPMVQERVLDFLKKNVTVK